MMHAVITEGNHECKKSKGINKNFVEDELKYEDYKNVSQNSLLDHICHMKWTELKTKITKYQPIEIIKLLFLFIAIKSINLMDIVGYYIFMSLLVNYIKIISSNIDSLS